MFEFLQNLEPLHQGFWYTAIAASFIFLIQTVLTFIGGGHGEVAHADFSGDSHADSPFQLFSFRNLINFLLGFGWSGVAFYNAIGSKALLIFIAVLVGAGFIFLFFILILQIMKLTEDNTFKLENLIGRAGEVYLTIPENMSGKGKITISLNGTSHELQAMTEEKEKIQSGDSVRVVYIYDKILVVSKI
ncbi:serine protease [Chryseobacterium angstadtii]|uniref:Serine protease n=1 Tax=Chryseobacterium angstadtii TaxID=558151 RepID=A0A0J7IHM9_9FLAO|nr:NfeD family protein [Chryseobacterium angstadtii]KMQ65501.1 serine protease [Chryseobacterium angstadtii]